MGLLLLLVLLIRLLILAGGFVLLLLLLVLFALLILLVLLLLVGVPLLIALLILLLLLVLLLILLALLVLLLLLLFLLLLQILEALPSELGIGAGICVLRLPRNGGAVVGQCFLKRAHGGTMLLSGLLRLVGLLLRDELVRHIAQVVGGVGGQLRIGGGRHGCIEGSGSACKITGIGCCDALVIGKDGWW